MADGWGFIKRLGRQAESRPSGDDILKATSEFELFDDGAHGLSASPSPAASSIFSWKTAVSSLESLASVGSIKRLGGGRPASAGSSIMFDADEARPVIDAVDDSHSPPLIPKRPTPFQGSRANPTELPLAPARSALTFLDRVHALKDVHAAIRQEIHALQMQKVEEFAAVAKASGVDVAISHAVSKVTDEGRDGRPVDVNVRELTKEISERNRGSDKEDKNAFTLEHIQDHYYRGKKGSDLGSREIAENFKRNGADLAAAAIALMYINAGHDHIQANEINGRDQSVGHDLTEQSTSAAGPQKVRTRPALDDRSRGRDRSMATAAGL